MQWYAVIVLVVATFIAHGDARVASHDSAINSQTSNGAVRECPHKAVPDTVHTVPLVMLNKLRKCIEATPATDRRVSAAHGVDAYRRVFLTVCSEAPAARTCIDALDADASICLDAVERKMWTTIIDFMDTCITVTCADDSDLMVNMFGAELQAMSEHNKRRVCNCLQESNDQCRFGREADLSAFTLRKYRGLKTGRQCILNVAKDARTSANHFEQFADILIRSIKCLTPVTNEIVYCDTL